MELQPGQLFSNSVDTELGWLRVLEVAAPSRLKLEVLGTQETRIYSLRSHPLRRAQVLPGSQVRVVGSDSWLTVLSSQIVEGLWEFHTSSGSFSEWQLVDLRSARSLLDDWDQNRWSSSRLVCSRAQALKVLKRRQSDELCGMFGSRVELLAHQFWTAQSVLRQKVPRRALLADEVGLGKTMEAGLTLAQLHAKQQLNSVVVLVPQALKVQWLTELYRRFHLRFRLDHDDLLEKSEHRDWVISSLEELETQPVTKLDVLILDEAHRVLKNDTQRRIVEPWIEAAQNVLFLTATPELCGQQQILSVLGKTEQGSVNPLVFQSRRQDLGLESRRRLNVLLADSALALESELVQFFEKALHERTKVFAICQDVKTLQSWEKKLTQRLGRHFAIFHEQLSLVERDRFAAYFADPEGALFLLSTEIGGEGRNFQFCSNLLFLDLPSDPWLVEQRIGRLDRIGQLRDVQLWVPLVRGSAEESVFEKLRDETQIFERPWTGTAREDGNIGGGGANLGALSYQGPPRLNPRRAVTADEFRELLIAIYDGLGVHVEDLDSDGGLIVSSTNLTFVENVPTLLEKSERSLTLDRAKALVREDWMWMTEDHPETVELLQFFVQGPWGRISICERPQGVSASTLAWAFIDDDWVTLSSSGDCEPGIAEDLWGLLKDRRKSLGDSKLRRGLEKLPLHAEAAILFIDH